jgi:hypothetical protein
MDGLVHKRFLDYRERHIYFAKESSTPCLTYEDFVLVDAEERCLDAKEDARDDDEEARFVALRRLLFRD